jgi:hypothetical protein
MPNPPVNSHPPMFGLYNKIFGLYLNNSLKVNGSKIVSAILIMEMGWGAPPVKK